MGEEISGRRKSPLLRSKPGTSQKQKQISLWKINFYFRSKFSTEKKEFHGKLATEKTNLLNPQKNQIVMVGSQKWQQIISSKGSYIEIIREKNNLKMTINFK